MAAAKCWWGYCRGTRESLLSVHAVIGEHFAVRRKDWVLRKLVRNRHWLTTADLNSAQFRNVVLLCDINDRLTIAAGLEHDVAPVGRDYGAKGLCVVHQLVV